MRTLVLCFFLLALAGSFDLAGLEVAIQGLAYSATPRVGSRNSAPLILPQLLGELVVSFSLFIVFF